MVASRTVLVRIRADADQLHRELATSTTGMRRFGDEADRTDRSIDRLSGRVRLLGEVAGSLGPGLVPVLGATAQATAGLATQMGFTVLAAGSAVIAFQGMGDALKALSDARLDPTTANLAKAEAAMERLSPAGQDLARTISGLSDEWEQTKAIAQGGLFPGVDQAIDSMMTRLPELQRILATVSTTAGDLLAEGADSLASDRWDGLFTYLETSAKPILTDTAHTAGDLTHALTELIIAMDPLTRDFTRGLAAAADDFDQWASGLSQTEGFQDFVDYMRTEGPHVAETLGDIAGSLASVVEASAGAGSISLDFLQIIANTVKTIADSPVGPVLVQLIQLVSTMALLNRAWGMFSTGTVATFVQGQRQAVSALTTTISAQQRATMSVSQLATAQAELSAQQKAAVGTLGRGAAGIAGMGLAALGTQKHITGLGTASGALMGFAVGGLWGAAIGGAIGLLGELATQSQEAAARSDDFAATLDRQTGALTENSRAWVANQLGADYLARLKEAGVDLEAMTTALLEGGDAWEQFSSQATAAMGDVEAVDGNLAAMAESRGYEMGKAAQGAGILGGKVAGLADTIRDGKADFQLYGEAVGDTSSAFRNAAANVDAFTSNLQELNAWLDRRAAMRDYKQAVEDANKVLKDNTSTHREIAAALDNVARKTGVVTEGMSKADRQKFLTEALADLRDMKGQGDVADGVIRRLLAQLRELNGTDVNTYINVITRRTTTGSAQTPGFGPQIPQADGGTVPKTGRGYADRHPYLLADGEEIISNRYGQADRHRQLLKTINDNRLPEPAPAVFSYSAAGAAGSSLGNTDALTAELRQTRADLNAQLTQLRRATTDIAPGRTGRAVMDRINEGAAQGMREAQW